MRTTRIAILFHRIGPYHLSRLQAASRISPIVAIESSGVDTTYAWDAIDGTNDFTRVTLFEQADAQELPATEVVIRMGSALDEIQPAVVIVPGWADPAALGAINWCAHNHVPAIIMSDSTAWDLRRVAWKEWIKRRIVALTSTALVGGSPHADYMQQLGMPKERIFLGYDVVDNGYFATAAAKYRCQLSVDLGEPSRVVGCPEETTENRERRTENRGQRSVQTGCSSTIHDLQPSGTRQTATGSPKGETGAPRQSTIPYSPYFLASNRFIEKKNLFRLLDAYARYGRADRPRSADLSPPGRVADDQTITSCPQGDNHGAPGRHALPPTDNSSSSSADLRPPTSAPWPLVMLGDGELKPQLLAHCAKLGLQVIESAPWEVFSSSEIQNPKSKIVYFPGFRQIDELPRFYAHAGAFVHASTTEQWGLVVNEAMASGLPVIVSNRVGCARDLVQEGVNGFTFDPHDVEQLAQLMLKVSASDFPLSDFGNASRTIIADWGPERFVAGLKQAVDCALLIGPKRATFLQRLILMTLLRG